MELNFKKFMEGLADFGFNRPRTGTPSGGRPEKENPVNTFDFEYMRDILVERELGQLRPTSRFVNEVTWGQGAGSIRLWVDPKAGVYIDRLGTDLGGTPRWYTKQYFQINRHGYGGYEDTVTEEIYDRLEEVQKKPIDSPKSDYKDLQSLVVQLAERLRREGNPVFLFDKVQKMTENRYLICFNVRGHGVQAPGQCRYEKFVTDVNYYPNEGYIRAIMNAYTSPLGQHKWEVSGPDCDMTFFPTQDRDEIIGPLASNLKFY